MPKKKSEFVGKDKGSEKKDYLDLADEIDAEMIYLEEIVGLIHFAFQGKAMSAVPLSNVMDDIFERLERLRGTIAGLKDLAGKKSGRNE